MRSHEELNALCEKAVAYKRRQLATAERSEDAFGAWAYHSKSCHDLTPGPDGWVVLSILHDAINGQRYRIWWEPATDPSRLDGPRQ
jgi:hypothetical protein